MKELVRYFITSSSGKGIVRAVVDDDGNSLVELRFCLDPDLPEKNVVLHASARLTQSLKLAAADLECLLCRIAISQAQKTSVQLLPPEGLTARLDITVLPWNGDLSEVPHSATKPATPIFKTSCSRP